MIQSLIVYGLLIILLFFLGYLYSRDYKGYKFSVFNPYIILMLLTFSIICGVRYNVGVDYHGYYNCYISSKTQEGAFFHMEKGWSLISEMMSRNDVHFTWYFGLIGFVQFLFLIKSFEKYTKLLPWGILVFFLMGQFILFMNVLRQAIVVVVFLWIMMRKQKIKFWELIFISIGLFFIHKTAILMIFFYPLIIYKKAININLLIASVFYICCVIFGLKSNVLADLLSNPIIFNILGESDYASYINEPGKALAGTNRQVGLGYMLIVVLNIVTILSFKYLNMKDRCYPEYSKWFILWFVGLCMNAIVPSSIIVGRITMLLVVFSIPIYALILKNTMVLSPFLTIKHTIAIFALSSMGLVFLFSYIISPMPTTVFHFYWEYPWL